MFFSRAAYIFLLKGEKKTVGVQVLPNPAKQSLLSGGSRSDKKKRKKNSLVMARWYSLFFLHLQQCISVSVATSAIAFVQHMLRPLMHSTCSPYHGGMREVSDSVRPCLNEYYVRYIFY